MSFKTSIPLLSRVPRMGIKIYTKSGDKGKTGLYGTTQRFSKTDLIFEVLGTNDELSSHIGLAHAHLQSMNGTSEQLERIQGELQELNSLIASKKLESKSTIKTLHLEEWIDEMDKELPELKNFILPVIY